MVVEDLLSGFLSNLDSVLLELELAGEKKFHWL